MGWHQGKTSYSRLLEVLLTNSFTAFMSFWGYCYVLYAEPEKYIANTETEKEGD
jgi:hypothetical protein